MKRLLLPIFTLLLGSSAIFMNSSIQAEESVLAAAQNTTTKQAGAKEARLPWIQSYEKGLEEAKAKNLPIYLIFTGPDWCFYCHQMEEKIFSDPAFIKAVTGKFVFVEILLPKSRDYSPELKELMKSYDVRFVPTSIVLSSDAKKELGRWGYPRISAAEFADFVVKAAYSN